MNKGRLEPIHFEKQAMRFLETTSHAKYDHNGVEKNIPLLKTSRDGNHVKIYVYFDDSIVGSIKNPRLVDTDGDVVAVMEREVIKDERKGFYALFSYKFGEEPEGVITDEKVQ